MRICFDLDETLCYGHPYKTAKPIPGRADMLASLKEQGHTVIIYTARYMTTCENNVGKVVKNIGKLTLDQLDEWGFEYDEIYFGKPNADIYVDDKALHVSGINNIHSLVNVSEARRHNVDLSIDSKCDKINELIAKIDSIQEK